MIPTRQTRLDNLSLLVLTVPRRELIVALKIEETSAAKKKSKKWAIGGVLREWCEGIGIANRISEFEVEVAYHYYHYYLYVVFDVWKTWIMGCWDRGYPLERRWMDNAWNLWQLRWYSRYRSLVLGSWSVSYTPRLISLVNNS